MKYKNTSSELAINLDKGIKSLARFAGNIYFILDDYSRIVLPETDLIEGFEQLCFSGPEIKLKDLLVQIKEKPKAPPSEDASQPGNY